MAQVAKPLPPVVMHLAPTPNDIVMLPNRDNEAYSPPPEDEVDENVDADADADADVYGDQDDAQSFIQPALSPVATRLTSIRTPAAEKAAAMDGMPGEGYFDPRDDQGDDRPSIVSIMNSDSPPASLPSSPESAASPPAFRGNVMGSLTEHRPSLAADLPAPWRAGPKEFRITEPTSPKPSAMSNVFLARSRRSSSVSENALKKLSKALPSITIPSGFITNIPTPSFWTSLHSSQKDEQTSTAPGPPRSATLPTRVSQGPFLSLTPDLGNGGLARSDSRTHTLRKSTSDDSLLYHSLSRVSSFGDDARFSHVREQVNSRFKAIKDSFDGPSFKMPQLPNLLNVPQKKSSSDLSTGTTPRSGNSPRLPYDSLSPLDSVLETLTGDIVVMGGYRGSILRSSQPPHRQLWVPVKVGLKIRKVNMEVGLDLEDEEDMENHIFASGMLQNIGPVDISKRFFKKLRECENAKAGRLRVHDYGYDWRLSPHLLSRRLISFLEKLPSNQPGVPEGKRGALVLAHSLGGLITRHAVNKRPELFSGVLFAGTPQRCVNVLGPLRNGDAVLLNEKVLTAQVNFSLRTTFAFLPEDGFCFVDKFTGEQYPVDFFNVEDWIKYRLSPCVSAPARVNPPLGRNNTFGSLRSLSESLPSLPLRGRSNTIKRGLDPLPDRHAQAGAAVTSAGTVPSMPANGQTGSAAAPEGPKEMARNVAYLKRTLAETKQFRAELAHNPEHQTGNAYPPLAAMYGKDTPTVYAARVAGVEGIECADAFDDLVFRGGDGVVLGKEALLPLGYQTVRNGCICTDRGHVGMLGDLNAVGRAIHALVRARQKGIGLGKKK